MVDYNIIRAIKKQKKEDESIVYSLVGEEVSQHFEETDSFYVHEGYVTITPLHYDLTNFNILKDVAKWF